MFFRLDAVQTIDQLKDVYSHFMMYYGNDIPIMQEEQRKKALEEKRNREGGEGEDKDDIPKVEPPKLKKPRKRDLYTICHEAGIVLYICYYCLTHVMKKIIMSDYFIFELNNYDFLMQ